ncbi:Elongator complex protein [Trichinella spiralis]|uniref:Elongator complex protein n=1 Tax=Trichinella spiralis TaxID=6334 RepID=A0ABR3K0K0_TRISP
MEQFNPAISISSIIRMYTQLDDFLAFSPNCLPNGKVVVIQDDHTIDGSFLLYQFISMYYRADAKILLVCTQNPSSHYETTL